MAIKLKKQALDTQKTAKSQKKTIETRGRNPKQRHGFYFWPFEIAEIFDVSDEAVCQWKIDKESDGTMDIRKIIQAKAEKEKSTGRSNLEEEKLGLQIEKMKIELEDMKKTSISLAEVQERFVKHASDAVEYFTEFGRLNLHYIAGRPVEDIQKYWIDLVRPAFNGFVKAFEK